jgi:hypothetical protein
MVTVKRVVTVTANEYDEGRAIKSLVSALYLETSGSNGFVASRLTLTSKPSPWMGRADKLIARVILTKED